MSLYPSDHVISNHNKYRSHLQDASKNMYAKIKEKARVDAMEKAQKEANEAEARRLAEFEQLQKEFGK